MPASVANRLAGETSPYLRQHADHPVAWQPWDAQTLALAHALDRPILLSIGYSACHWCHVMAHECFEDNAVAAVMNRHFINVKVDREERPDLDQIYQNAHQMLSGRPGGWPLTMFLSPDGTPFHGGTYFPKTARHGLPGFIDLCERIADVWATRRADILDQNRAVLDALAQLAPAAEPGGDLDGQPLGRLRAQLLAAYDREHGGFGDAPKFPHPADLAFLLARENDPEARHAALHTLRRMAAGGIHDQLGGGFYRYSVDARWEIPHFEKMLYDNAQLLRLYAEAAALTEDEALLAVADDIVAWLMREMAAPDGSFCAALDADSEGEEGRFYVWDRTELSRLLTPEEADVAARHWGLDGPPNVAGRVWHLRIAAPVAAEESALLAAARKRLFAARERRVRPERDDKVLTSWNALAIGALCRGARCAGREDWLTMARRALDALKSRRWRDGALFATDRLPGYLDDWAFLLDALIELLQADFRRDDLAFARALADGLLARFEDAQNGGFFFTAHDHEHLIQRPKPGHDNALPSGNGVAARALQRLGHLLGETRYLEAARRTLVLWLPQMRRHPGGFATLAMALEEALDPPWIVVLRGPADDLAAWRRPCARMPGCLTLALPNGLTDLPAPLAKPDSPHVIAWPCRGVICTQPVATLQELKQVVRGSS